MSFLSGSKFLYGQNKYCTLCHPGQWIMFFSQVDRLHANHTAYFSSYFCLNETSLLSLQKGKPPKPGTKVVLRPRRQRGSQFLFESPNSDVINGQPYTDSTEPLKHHSAGDADTRNEEGNYKYPPGGSSHVGNFTYVVLNRCRIRSF